MHSKWRWMFIFTISIQLLILIQRGGSSKTGSRSKYFNMCDSINADVHYHIDTLEMIAKINSLTPFG